METKKKELYHCLDRETPQGIPSEILISMLEYKDTVEENLKEHDMEIVDWIGTPLKTHHDYEEASFWTFTIYNPKGNPFPREAFDEDWSCEVSWFEPHPYYQVVTVICQ